MLGLKSRIGAQEIHETAQHESGADQEDTCQAHFRHHESIAKAKLTPAVGGASPTLVQGLSKIGSRGLQSRGESQQKSGRENDQQRESDHNSTHVNRISARDA